jgi:hypothetical protein
MSKYIILQDLERIELGFFKYNEDKITEGQSEF